ncbi:MAG TPA: ATP-binding protein [Candidatus Eisenbacteria bacterium]|nr:ATP-binding protein [Candidatus Eisenbacteria bacterium]
MSAPRPWRARDAFATQFGLLLGTFAAMILSLLLLTAVVANVLSSVRAYVGGEGLWSKAQKDAVHALDRYGDSRDERDLQAALAALAVPLGDRQAREELERPHPDMARVRAGFLAGRNHPDDVANMARLFRTFRRVSFMDRAIGIWARGAQEIARLRALALALHDAVGARPAAPARVAALLDQVHAENASLTRLEDDFSYTLGDAARQVGRLVLRVLAVVAALLLLVGSLLLGRLLSRIRDSNAHYRRLLEAANDAIFVSDLATGVVLEANARAAALTGVPADQLPGRTLASLHPPGAAGSVPGAGTAASGECDVLGPGGEPIPVEVSASVVELDGRAVVQSIYRDVRARRAAERQLREREEQLRQAQKMEAVGQLAGGVAHDFNNLLTALLGYSGVLLEQVGPDHPLRASAVEIRKASERAARLTQQLLAYSRRQVMEPRVLDLNAVTEDIEQMLRRLIGEDVRLATVRALNLGHVRVDRGQIEQVLVNLALNARDAMPHGGTLTIATGETEVEEGAAAGRVAGPAPGRYVTITVTDTGVGMSESTRARIFEPFFTTKERGRGTGLGLSTVDGIVRQSGGTIEVESAPGMGSTFRILLPRVDAELAPEPRPAPVPAGRGGGQTVLLVEDEDSVRDLARRTLEAEGYRVLVANDGDTALAAAAAYAGPIHLLVTDVIMPRMNGRRLAEALCAQRDGVRVLYMSGYTDDEMLLRVGLEPGEAFLRKPFGLRELAAKVRETLGGGLRRQG